MKVQHPDFPNITRDVADADSWLAQGWLEAEVLKPCPTCGAVRDEPCVTASGAETERHAKRD